LLFHSAIILIEIRVFLGIYEWNDKYTWNDKQEKGGITLPVTIPVSQDIPVRLLSSRA
jgi:hypothetical protein